MIQNDLSQLKAGAHIHLIGICGTAMASLAGLLKAQGFKITGSDQNVYPPMSTQLESLGIEIMQGYKAENLSPKPDLVIVGNVISRHFEEAKALEELDIPYTSLPVALGQFAIANRSSVVIAGTHGKTTTTSMMAALAESCDHPFGFLIGGIPLNFGKSFLPPPQEADQAKSYFVIEGDEYDTAYFDKVPKFIHYKPKFVILTSIEFDHADIYRDLDHVKESFRELLRRIPEDGLLVYNAEDENIESILGECKAKKVSYGLSKGDYHASEREVVVGRNQFNIICNGKKTVDIAIKSFGPYNTMNAVASYALANEMGWSTQKVLQGFANFKGVKRRQEIISTSGDVIVVEDFAHHPTAVKLTIDTMKEQFPDKKVWAVFEPRSATSRRKVFEQDYIEAFSMVDALLLAKPFDQAKIEESDRFSADRVIAELTSRNVNAGVYENADAIATELKSKVKSGEVVLVMSNGGFDGIYKQLIW